MSGYKGCVPCPSAVQLDTLEAENVRQAAMQFMTGRLRRDSVTFTVPWFQSVHRKMFGNVWSWAGFFRRTDTPVGVPHQQIPEQLAILSSDIHVWTGYDMALSEQAVRLHHRATLVHPFSNGNGRWSRMVSNIWLRFHRQPIINWPAQVKGSYAQQKTSPIRERYIEALRAADGMDYEPLMDLHKEYQAL